jgi:hypothetical protein
MLNFPKQFPPKQHAKGLRKACWASVQWHGCFPGWLQLRDQHMVVEKYVSSSSVQVLNLVTRSCFSISHNRIECFEKKRIECFEMQGRVGKRSQLYCLKCLASTNLQSGLQLQLKVSPIDPGIYDIQRCETRKYTFDRGTKGSEAVVSELVLKETTSFLERQHCLLRCANLCSWWWSCWFSNIMNGWNPTIMERLCSFHQHMFAKCLVAARHLAHVLKWMGPKVLLDESI